MLAFGLATLAAICHPASRLESLEYCRAAFPIQTGLEDDPTARLAMSCPDYLLLIVRKCRR